MVGTPRPRAVYSLTDATPARTIWVYRNGDPFYLGRKFVINHRYFSIGAKKPQRKKRDEVIRPVVHSNIQVPSKWQSDYKKPLTINVFTNGDLLVAPVKIIIPKFTQKSWNGVLGLINEKVLSKSGGVHRLYTLNGHPVHGSDDLEHNQFYVGCGKEKFQPLPYWQHQKVPEDVRCYIKTLPKSGDNEKGSPGTPERPRLKKHPVEASQRGNLKPSTGPSKHGAGDRASVYYAKSEKASRERAPEPLSSDDGGGVYKARVPPQDVKGAQEIHEDKNTQVERPVDQTPAEVVHEEDLYSNVRNTSEEAEDDEEGKEKKGIFKKMFGFMFKKKDAKEGTDDYFSKEQDAKKKKKIYSPENELFDAYDYV